MREENNKLNQHKGTDFTTILHEKTQNNDRQYTICADVVTVENLIYIKQSISMYCYSSSNMASQREHTVYCSVKRLATN